MSTWPEYMRIAESPVLTVFASKADSVLGGRLMGYMIAKSEGFGEDWHGHVTALSVAPEYRRMGLASRLMREFEDTSERQVSFYVLLLQLILVHLGLSNCHSNCGKFVGFYLI